jgi:hypothetical protein
MRKISLYVGYLSIAILFTALWQGCKKDDKKAAGSETYALVI